MSKYNTFFTLSGLDPDAAVYWPTIWVRGVGVMSAQEAYDTEEEARKHFWYDYPSVDLVLEGPWIRTVTGREYVQESLRKRGMNPFWDLGRLKVVAEWMKEINDDGEAAI